jgi:hypothetical protein
MKAGPEYAINLLLQDRFICSPYYIFSVLRTSRRGMHFEVNNHA